MRLSGELGNSRVMKVARSMHEVSAQQISPVLGQRTKVFPTQVEHSWLESGSKDQSDLSLEGSAQQDWTFFPRGGSQTSQKYLSFNPIVNAFRYYYCTVALFENKADSARFCPNYTIFQNKNEKSASAADAAAASTAKSYPAGSPG